MQDVWLNLSMRIVTYKTSTCQIIKLVLDTVQLAMEKEEPTAELLLHSDQGLHCDIKLLQGLLFSIYAMHRPVNAPVLLFPMKTLFFLVATAIF